MADTKLTALNEIGAPILSTDIFYLVDDPGGTPLSRKSTFARVTAFVAGKQTMWVPANLITPRTTAGCAPLAVRETNSISYAGLGFDQTTDEGAFFNVAFPKKWNEGTVTIQYFWTATGGAGVEDVQFECRAGCFADSAAINVTGLGTAVAVTDVWLTDNDVHVSAESAAITIANAAVDTICWFEIIRDVSDDTLTDDAFLIGVKLFYTTDATNDT